MASRYKRFLVVCQQWPVLTERAKHMELLGSHIQKKIEENFVYKESTQLNDPVKCDRILLSLEKLSTDFYKNKYPCISYVATKDANATNITNIVNELICNNKKKIQKI